MVFDLCSSCKFIYCLFLYFEVVYQIKETVSHWDIQMPRRELKMRCTAEYF